MTASKLCFDEKEQDTVHCSSVSKYAIVIWEDNEIEMVKCSASISYETASCLTQSASIWAQLLKQRKELIIHLQKTTPNLASALNKHLTDSIRHCETLLEETNKYSPAFNL